MDIVLGVSLTPKTVHMVLVEGAKADGVIVDHDTFDLWSAEGTANLTAADQLVAAVLGTEESANEGGHVLKAVGVTWTDRAAAASLRAVLTARGISDVVLVSELHAAGALAQAAGRAVGYESTGLLFVDRDTATLSVVRSDDGSVVKVLSRSLHASDAMAVLAEMVAAVDAQAAPPQGMFIVGSGVDIDSVKEHLSDLVSIPVNAPEEPALALARGAALAAANAPPFDATTAGLGGLAYSQDPDGATAGGTVVGLANASNADTQMRPVHVVDRFYADDFDFDDEPVDERRKPFLLVGSALTAIFVIGVVGLVISLAVSIRPTADQRPDAGQAAIIPSVMPLVPATREAVPAVPAPPPPPPPEETIKAPVPVVQQAPAPRRVSVAPAPQAPAIADLPPAAPPPPPAAPPPVIPPPVAVPPPIFVPPPVFVPPRIFLPPIFRPPWRRDSPQYSPYPPQQQQYPPQAPEYPPQAPQYPPQAPQYPPQAPQYPPQAPQYPPQAPQSPSQQSDYGDGGSGGGGYGGHDSGGPYGRHDTGGGSYGSPGNGACFALLCVGGGGRH